MQFRQQPATPQVVESVVTMERFDEVDGDRFQFDVTLSYDRADPFAVSVVLHSVPRVVRWTFARDLLVSGMYEPTGDGDVFVWPCLDVDARSVVVVEMRSPGGVFMGLVSSRELHRFVREMLDVVPLGSEPDLLDLDALVERLLDEAPAPGE